MISLRALHDFFLRALNDPYMHVSFHHYIHTNWDELYIQDAGCNLSPLKYA